MNSYKLRHLAQIQEVSESLDSYRAVVQEWITIDEAFVQIDPLTAKEIERAKSVYGEATHRLVLRYFPGLTSKNRIIAKGKTFNLVSVINEEEQDHWHICLGVVVD